jgi:hypothetical protein
MDMVSSGEGGSGGFYRVIGVFSLPRSATEFSAEAPTARGTGGTPVLYESRRFEEFGLGFVGEAARKHMNDGGGESLTLHVDLPPWFDDEDGKHGIGWRDAAERQAWFGRVCACVTDVSLMNYERKSEASIKKAAAWEIGTFAGKFRVGLAADIGPRKTWSSPDALRGMLEQLEQLERGYGGSVGMDVHAFTLLVEAQMRAVK